MNIAITFFLFCGINKIPNNTVYHKRRNIELVALFQALKRGCQSEVKSFCVRNRPKI